MRRFGSPRGVVAVPASDASWCVKGAVLAVRLGYVLLPMRMPGDEAYHTELLHLARSQKLPVLWLGHEPLPEQLGDTDLAVQTLPDDAAVYRSLRQAGLEADYLLIFNSADVAQPDRPGTALGEMWVQGLSLLAPLSASYRAVFPFDACSLHPDFRKIEAGATALVAQNQIPLRFQAVLASPGAVPFLIEPLRAIGSQAEEMVRDIHVRINDDLFFDLAEGRLFQSTPGGLSLQLLSSKHYHRIYPNSAGGREVLMVTTPHVASGIIFASDDALIGSQLRPLLEAAGHKVRLFSRRESNYRQVAQILPETEFFLYTGHGGPETLHTHGRYLGRRDLPDLPPLVAYASACSTVSMRPHWTSSSDGLEWEGVEITPTDVIGLSLVEKGAVCYVGGATTEDLQFSTAMYGIFMESLLIRGRSVGEAVRDTRNFVSMYMSVLSQAAPASYRLYKYGMANAIHQQVLLGDPALVPCHGEKPELAFPCRLETATGTPGAEEVRYSLQVSIPAERWSRHQGEVDSTEPSRKYYRSLVVEVVSPYGLGVISWGDFYVVAPNAENISRKALMSSFLHLTLDLPPGLAPLRLDLSAAAAAPAECLLCSSSQAPPPKTVEFFRDFRIPWLMLPPLRMDLSAGWPFSVEETGDGRRVHWLAPLLLVDDLHRAAVPARELRFELTACSGREVQGKVLPGDGEDGRTFLVSAVLPVRPPAGSSAESKGKDGKKKGGAVYAPARVLTGENGHFRLFYPPEAAAVLVEEQFPLYELTEDYSPLVREPLPLAPGAEAMLPARKADAVEVTGLVLDSRTAVPLPEAVVRAWRGKTDLCGDPLLEGFAGESTAVAGRFRLLLPPGEYLLYAVGRDGALRYKSRCISLTVRKGGGRHLLLPLEAAAVVKGKISYQGYKPTRPAWVDLERFPREEQKEVLARTFTRKDGTFECLIGFQGRFRVVIEEEGWHEIYDDNGGKGYRLSPGETLEKEYLLVPRE